MTPGQAQEIPEAFGRHVRSQFPADYVLPENEIAGRWMHMTGPAGRKFWHEVQAAIATQDARPAPGSFACCEDCGWCGRPHAGRCGQGCNDGPAPAPPVKGKTADIDPNLWVFYVRACQMAATVDEHKRQVEANLREQLGDAQVLVVGGARVATRITREVKGASWTKDYIRRIPRKGNPE